MPLVIEMFMAFSHRYILDAIRELSSEDRRITYEEIAVRAGCSSKTVQRAVKVLSENEKITLMTSGKGYGYKFKVIA